MLHSLHLQKSLSSYNYIRVGAQLKVSFFSENQEEAEGAQAAHPGPLLTHAEECFLCSAFKNLRPRFIPPPD